VAGSGVIFMTSAFIFICAGALGELAYKLGDLREAEFSALTQRLGLRSRPRAQAAELEMPATKTAQKQGNGMSL
jgi:hypothetical protein